MSASQHMTTNPVIETPSISETAVSGATGSGAAVESGRGDGAATAKEFGSGMSSQPGSAEGAAEKLYKERMEDEYAKREGGA